MKMKNPAAGTRHRSFVEDVPARWVEHTPKDQKEAIDALLQPLGEQALDEFRMIAQVLRETCAAIDMPIFGVPRKRLEKHTSSPLEAFRILARWHVVGAVKVLHHYHGEKKRELFPSIEAYVLGKDIEQAVIESALAKEDTTIVLEGPFWYLEHRINKPPQKTEITYTPADKQLRIGDATISLASAANQADLCRVLFKDIGTATKEWNTDEVLMEWGYPEDRIYDKDGVKLLEENRLKAYTAAKDVTEKVLKATKGKIPDLLTYTTKTVTVNSKYHTWLANK